MPKRESRPCSRPSISIICLGWSTTCACISTEAGLPYTLTSDLLIRDVPLRDGVSPDVALWPGQPDPVGEKCRSLALAPGVCPAPILEVVSENTGAADADVQHEICRRAGVAEYWLYDPGGYAGGPPVCGWQLQETAYVPVPNRVGVVAADMATLYASGVQQTEWGLTAAGSLRLRRPGHDAWYRMTPEAGGGGGGACRAGECRDHLAAGLVERAFWLKPRSKPVLPARQCHNSTGD